jgi:hypothetical protein
VLKVKQGTQIEKLGFDEYTYRVKFKNSPIWSIYVSRVGGAVTFFKSGINPESVDRFEARRNGYNTEIYLHTTDKFGSHEDYIGETDDYVAAEDWVGAVNKIYENCRNHNFCRLTG